MYFYEIEKTNTKTTTPKYNTIADLQTYELIKLKNLITYKNAKIKQIKETNTMRLIQQTFYIR